jgi:hypothetical protein
MQDQVNYPAFFDRGSVALSVSDRARLEYIRDRVYERCPDDATLAGALRWAVERGALHARDPVRFPERAGGAASLHVIPPDLAPCVRELMRAHGSARAGVRWAVRVAERALREGVPEYRVDHAAVAAGARRRQSAAQAHHSTAVKRRAAERRDRWRRVQLEGEAYSAGLYAQRHAPAPGHEVEREREQAAVRAEQARLEAERAAELAKNLEILHGRRTPPPEAMHGACDEFGGSDY